MSRPTLPTRRDLLRLGAAGLAAAALPSRIVRADDAPGRIFATITPADPKVVAGGGTNAIVSYPVDGGQGLTLVEGATGGRVSPDGTTLAYGFRGALWVRPVDGEGEPKQVTDVGVIPVWAPDGASLLAVTPPKGGAGGSAWRVPLAEGGGEPARLDLPEADLVEDWSPAGDWLAVSTPPAWSEVALIRADGTGRRLLRAGGLCTSPRFSRDGRRVAFIHWGEDRTSRIKVVDLDGGNEQVAFEHVDHVATAVCWSPEGKALAACLFTWEWGPRDEPDRPRARVPGRDDSRIEILSLDGGKPVRITPPVSRALWPDWR